MFSRNLLSFIKEYIRQALARSDTTVSSYINNGMEAHREAHQEALFLLTPFPQTFNSVMPVTRSALPLS
jgi:hypothetical protein